MVVPGERGMWVCATKVVIPWEMLCSGVNAKSSTRVTALYAAMISTSNVLTDPWISSFPIG